MADTFDIYYTTAPESYDGFGTETIEMTGYFDVRGKELRKVKILDKSNDYQISRYNSGMHGAFKQKEFDELMAMEYPTFTRKDEPTKQEMAQENNLEDLELKNPTENLKYIPQSESCNSVDTITPKDMRYEMLKAIETIDRRVNGVDEYVAEKLGYIVGNASPEERVKGIKYLCDAFSSEQVDAIAVAIYNIEQKGQGCIIGDQTGIGKGRIAGGIIRYGMKRGLKPIFITEKTNLFSDIYRDLISIGSDSDIPLKVLVGSEFVEKKTQKKEKLTKEEKEELEAEKQLSDANGVEEDEEEETELVEVPIYKKNKEYPNKFTYFDIDENGVEKKIVRERIFSAKPFILNSKDSKTQRRIEIKDEDGHILYYSDEKVIQAVIGKKIDTDEQTGFTKKGKPSFKKIFIDGTMSVPSDCDFVLATYSQFNKGKASPKSRFLKKISKNNIIIMDESHNASGSSNVGEFLQDVLKETLGVTFLSATFAKRPDNMPIYASKTCIGDANMDNDSLIYAIESGGVALQEIVSSLLVSEGQMIRRERSYEGIEINYKYLDESQTAIGKDFLNLEEINSAIMDSATEIIRDIIKFQKDHVDPLIKKLDKMLAEGQGRAGKIKGTDEAGIKNTPAFSGVFNLINQLLFSIKAQAVGMVAVERLKEGKKPLISFASTMESFLNDLKNDEGENVKVGDIINSDFGKVFEKRLYNTLKYKVVEADGTDVVKFIEVDEQSDDFQIAYKYILNKIKSNSIGICSSPIDVVIDVINKAGYSVLEVTGRTRQLKLLGDDLAEIKPKVKVAPNDAFRKFNNNEVDVLLINQAGSTGASAHAVPTKKVSKDQVKQRVMIFLQSELNVNTEVQKRGRINRTGQILKPIYDYVISSVPAEKRLSMMLEKKLKSLSANTTSSQIDAMGGEDEKEVLDPENIDFLNKYGDKIVFNWLLENRKINTMIDDPLKINNADSSEAIEQINYSGASHKISGRVAILPIEYQEKFYNDVFERYYSEVSLLIETGEYDLKVKKQKLRAETIDKSIAIVGKGGKSVFSKNTILEKCMVDNLRKPYKEEDVRKMIDKSLNGLTPEQLQQNMIDAFTTYIDSKYEQELKDLNDYFEDVIKNIPTEKAILKIEDLEVKQQSIERKKSEYEGELNESIENLQKITNAKRNNILSLFKFFKVGRPIQYPSPNYAVGKTMADEGIFVGFDFLKKENNNYAPSSIKLKFAFTTSLKFISLPASKYDIVSLVKTLTQENISSYATMEDALGRWNYEIKDKLNDRVERYILTGNILQGCGVPEYKGSLISYTTIDNKIKKGILLPETFFKGTYTSDVKTVKVPIIKALPIILEMNSTMQATGFLSIDVKERYDYEVGGRVKYYEILVPKNAGLGAKYYQDSTLIELSMGGTFNAVSKNMMAQFSMDNIEKVINYLNNEFNTSVNLTRSQFQRIEDTLVMDDEDESVDTNESEEFLRKLDEARRQEEENARLEKERQEQELRDKQEEENNRAKEKMAMKKNAILSKLNTLFDIVSRSNSMARGGRVAKKMSKSKAGR